MHKSFYRNLPRTKKKYWLISNTFPSKNWFKTNFIAKCLMWLIWTANTIFFSFFFMWFSSFWSIQSDITFSWQFSLHYSTSDQFNKKAQIIFIFVEYEIKITRRANGWCFKIPENGLKLWPQHIYLCLGSPKLQREHLN